MASENVKSTLAIALDDKKQANLEMRQLESTLERISHTSDEHNTRGAKLEREKKTLEMRVRELEANLRELSQPALTSTPGRRAASAVRGRTSSLSSFRITTLEQDLVEALASLAKKDADLHALSQKLSQVQGDIIKADNEKAANERKWISQVEELQASLEEKEEELGYLREQQGDGSREEALLRRIEEDDAKIVALEQMLRNAEDSQQLKEKTRRLEAQLKEEQRRLATSEENGVRLAREKEEALDELQECRREQYRLTKELNEWKARTHAISQK
jgi:myosin protein heavy chain